MVDLRCDLRNGAAVLTPLLKKAAAHQEAEALVVLFL